MRVTVSVRGRFHAFYLARELQRHGYLHRIITSYPVFETVKYGVERDKIKSLFVHEAVRVWRKAPRRIQGFFGLTPNERATSAYATAVSSIVACSYSDGLR